jgi:hypothetical protein
VQAYEYAHAPFGFKGNIYTSTFFMATGFHGFHVIVGTIFLIVCLMRATRATSRRASISASRPPPGTGTSSTWCGCSCSSPSTSGAAGARQLSRGQEKDALIARYQTAHSLPPTAFPTVPIADEALPLFRRATGYCLRVAGTRRTAGTNRQDETGYVHIAECSTGAEGPGMAVQMGWSKDPNAKIAWSGGPVSGIIAPDSKMRMRLVSEQGLGGLQPTRAGHRFSRSRTTTAPTPSNGSCSR